MKESGTLYQPDASTPFNLNLTYDYIAITILLPYKLR